MCEICSKLTIKTPQRRHSRRSGVFIVNFKHVSYLFCSVYIVDFEQVNVSWVYRRKRQEKQLTSWILFKKIVVRLLMKHVRDHLSMLFQYV